MTPPREKAPCPANLIWALRLDIRHCSNWWISLFLTVFVRQKLSLQRPWLLLPGCVWLFISVRGSSSPLYGCQIELIYTKCESNNLLVGLMVKNQYIVAQTKYEIQGDKASLSYNSGYMLSRYRCRNLKQLGVFFWWNAARKKALCRHKPLESLKGIQTARPSYKKASTDAGSFYTRGSTASTSIIHTQLSRFNPAQTAHLTRYTFIHSSAYWTTLSGTACPALRCSHYHKHTNMCFLYVAMRSVFWFIGMIYYVWVMVSFIVDKLIQHW